MACSSFRALLVWCREVLSSRVSEVTLGSFSVRFWSLFVLPCLAVLVPGGAFGTLLSAAAATAAAAATGAAKQQQRHQPPSISHHFLQVLSSSRVSEVRLGTFSVRFWSLFVLPCLAVLVPGGAFGTLLSAAAAARTAAATAAATAPAA